MILICLDSLKNDISTNLDDVYALKSIFNNVSIETLNQNISKSLSRHFEKGHPDISILICLSEPTRDIRYPMEPKTDAEMMVTKLVPMIP